jgi:hypothetical protein
MMANMNALIAFINEMAIISDIHYGFIAFNDNIGTDAASISNPVNNLPPVIITLLLIHTAIIR